MKMYANKQMSEREKSERKREFLRLHTTKQTRTTTLCKQQYLQTEIKLHERICIRKRCSISSSNGAGNGERHYRNTLRFTSRQILKYETDDGNTTMIIGYYSLILLHIVDAITVLSPSSFSTSVCNFDIHSIEQSI